MPIGVSTGHPDITAGTIGARVKSGGNVWALSNNHVYADANAASAGDAVIQPGTYDGGSSSADDIGMLSDFEPIVFELSAFDPCTQRHGRRHRGLHHRPARQHHTERRVWQTLVNDDGRGAPT